MPGSTRTPELGLNRYTNPNDFITSKDLTEDNDKTDAAYSKVKEYTESARQSAEQVKRLKAEFENIRDSTIAETKKIQEKTVKDAAKAAVEAAQDIADEALEFAKKAAAYALELQNLIDPTTGRKEKLQQILYNLFSLHKSGAIKVKELKAFTANDVARQNMTVYEFNTRARQILMGGSNE